MDDDLLTKAYYTGWRTGTESFGEYLIYALPDVSTEEIEKVVNEFKKDYDLEALLARFTGV